MVPYLLCHVSQYRIIPRFFPRNLQTSARWKKRPPHPQAGAPQLAKLLYYQHDYSWLVVYLPLWKIWKSMGRMTSHILWKIKNVPNHQPVCVCVYIYICVCIYICIIIHDWCVLNSWTTWWMMPFFCVSPKKIVRRGVGTPLDEKPARFGQTHM